MERGGAQVLPPLTEKLRIVEGFLGEEEQFFFKGVVPSRSNTLQGVVSHPRVYGQHKLVLVG